MAALEIVDYVIIDENKTPLKNISNIKPDFFAKGFEYSKKIPDETLQEKNTVEKYGGEIIFSPGDIVYSSTKIINNLLRLGESIGDVMQETRKALDDDKVDEKEKEQISIEVIELEKKIAELKLKLNLGEKTDYKSQKKREP